MATVNHPLAQMDGGLFVLSFDYDDVSLQLLAFHAVNNDNRDWTVSATSTSTGKNYTLVVTAGTSLNQPIPNGAANRLQLSVTPSGKLDGVEWSIF